MISITPQMRILVAVEPVDLRKGIDGLAALCRERLETDPFSGCLFLFRSRRATAIRALVYDGQGFWMAHKRLSKGRFPWWPTGNTAVKTLQLGSGVIPPRSERSRARIYGCASESGGFRANLTFG
jgi:transposase